MILSLFSLDPTHPHVHFENTEIEEGPLQLHTVIITWLLSMSLLTASFNMDKTYSHMHEYHSHELVITRSNNT